MCDSTAFLQLYFSCNFHFEMRISNLLHLSEHHPLLMTTRTRNISRLSCITMTHIVVGIKQQQRWLEFTEWKLFALQIYPPMNAFL